MTATDDRPPSIDQLDAAAREPIGVSLTGPQRDAVMAVMAGRDTLMVTPTGSGKSAVYQLTGALLDGLTVVVSPLIPLQEDQLAAFGAWTSDGRRS